MTAVQTSTSGIQNKSKEVGVDNSYQHQQTGHGMEPRGETKNVMKDWLKKSCGEAGFLRPG